MKLIFAFLVRFFRKMFEPKAHAWAIYDANLAFRATTDSLTATETSSALTINGTPAGGLALVIDIPKQSVGDTMQVTLQHSTDNSTYTTLLQVETVASTTVAITDPKKIIRRFHTRAKYVRTVTTVAGTSPDFGAVGIRAGDADQWNDLPVGQNVETTQPY